MKHFYQTKNKLNFALLKPLTFSLKYEKLSLKLAIKTVTFLLSSLLIVFNTIAKEPIHCGKRTITKSNGLYESFRDAQALIKKKNVTLTVFNNYEGKLPKLSHNQMYYEFDLGKDRSGNRGRYRAVIKVQYSPRKIEASYFTQDHYETFCQVN